MYLGTVASLLVGATVRLAIDSRDAMGWMLTTLTLAAVSLPFLVALHEVGHAVFGRLVGLEVFQIVVGGGRTLWRGRIAGVLVSVGETPLSGLTLVSTARPRFARLQRAIVSLGGPAANLVFAAALLPLTPLVFPYALPNLARAGIAALFWTSLGLALLNLVPMRVNVRGARIASDGLRVLGSLFARAATLREWLLAHYAAAWHTAEAVTDIPGMLDAARAGSAAFPESAQMAMMLIVAVNWGGDARAARDLTRELLERTDLAPIVRAFAKSNLAFFEFLVGEDGDRDEADRLSSEVIAAIPWHPSIRAVRAAVMLWLNQPEPALEQLQAAREDDEDGGRHGDVALLLSIAYAQLARLEEARRFLEQGERLASPAPLRERARLALQRAL